MKLNSILRTPIALLASLAILTAMPLPGQAPTEIEVDIDRSRAASLLRISVPFPALAPGIDPAMIQRSLFSPLTRDLAFSEIFAIVPLPPNSPATLDSAKKAPAQAFLQMDVTTEGEDFVIEVRLFDVNSQRIDLGKRYRGRASALTRIAHTIANDLVRHYNGTPGIFLTQIAFVSTRDGNKEIYLMDFDGSNQRRVTSHGTISLNPDWSPDAEQLVYTSFSRNSSDLYVINRRGGGRQRLSTGLGLNTATKFSPDGRDIAFVGSVRGNPDIYLMRADGSNIRRLTSATSIESTPAWSPTGRQIAFTSGRTGTPQIYVMDAEGTNVRRLSFDGNWNDDAAFSPNGDEIAYTSRVDGRFQIRVSNLTTGATRVLAGIGSNEQPTWSPDGRSLVFTSNRTGKWQLYRVAADGSNPVQLTTVGENTAPSWSKVIE